MSYTELTKLRQQAIEANLANTKKGLTTFANDVPKVLGVNPANVAVGAPVTIPIVPATDARLQLGFNIVRIGGTTAEGLMQLKLSNFTIIDEVDMRAFDKATMTDQPGYYMFPMPLTGRDRIELIVQATFAGPMFFNYYYL